MEDTVAYRAYASKQSPPASFFELQQDCIRSAKLAIADGFDLIEVEFPPLPANVLELDDVSAYDVAQANLKLAVDFAKGFTVEGQKVAILLPDEDEARIAMEQYTGIDDNPIARQEVAPGITLASIRQSKEGDERLLKVRVKQKKIRFPLMRNWVSVSGGKDCFHQKSREIVPFVCNVGTNTPLRGGKFHFFLVCRTCPHHRLT